MYNLLKRVSATHSVTLCSFIRRPEEREYLSELRFLNGVHTVLRGKAWQPRYVLQAGFSSYPFLYCTYNNPAMRELIGRLQAASAFDLVHIEPGYVWPSLPSLGLPVVVGEHNIEHDVYDRFVTSFSFSPLKPLLRIDVRKMKHWEHIVWNRADGVVAVSDDDARIIGRETRQPVRVVPNGVDVRQLTFRPGEASRNPVALFVGNFSWMQNRDALRFILDDVWPSLHEAVPSLTLRVVGRGLPAELRNKMRQNGLTLLEHVEDIMTEFHRATVLLAPIRIGGGTKFKILEAMATGLPVITTAVGFAGIKGAADREFLRAETAQDFVMATQRLLRDNTLREAITRRARKLVETAYNWDTIAETLEHVWGETYDRSRKKIISHHR